MSDFYVILGSRKYDDVRVRYPIAAKHGYLNAGGGETYWRRLQNLEQGDRVFAYVGGAGYVGIAEVTGNVMLARDARVDSGERLVDQPDIDEDFKDRACRRDDTTEWVVRVEWAKIVPVEQAVFEEGFFASPLTACRLRDQRTIKAVEARLGSRSAE